MMPRQKNTRPAADLSIAEFCALVGISRNTFRALPDDQCPRVVRAGKRHMIPASAARAWLDAEREFERVDLSAHVFSLRNAAER